MAHASLTHNFSTALRLIAAPLALSIALIGCSSDGDSAKGDSSDGGASAQGGADGGSGGADATQSDNAHGATCLAAEGDACNADTCPCSSGLDCLPEDGPGTNSDSYCFDTSMQGASAVGDACAYGFECASGNCFPSAAGDSSTCQAACLSAGAATVQGGSSCCSGAAQGGHCL